MSEEETLAEVVVAAPHWSKIADYRNAHYVNDSGAIDIEINHPEYGWVPYTIAGSGDQTSDILAARIIEDKITPLPYVAPPKTGAQVNAERDRRTDAGFEFAGVMFDFDAKAKGDIAGAASNALIALTLSGKDPADLRWHGGASDFAWIAQDNTTMLMSAAKVLQFGQAAAAHRSAHVFAARALKDLPEIPADYQDDKYWP